MANPLLTDEQNRRLANQNSIYNQIMQGFEPVQQPQEDSWLGGLSRGAKAGFGGVGAGLLHAGQAAFGTDGSLAAGFDAMAKNNAQRREWDLADTLSLDYLTNPEGLAYGLGQLAGSIALPALFGAGVAAAVPTGGTSLLGTGALIGAAGAAPMAISEGGNTYAQGLQQGMTEDEAKKAGLTDAAIKLPFYMLSEGLSGKVAQGLISKGLLNAEGKSLGRRAAESGAKILGNAANEAYEEGTENRSSAYALGDQRISSLGNIFNPFDWNEEDKAQAVGVFTPTLALGTLTGGAGHLRSRFDKKNSDVAEEIASEDGGTIEEAPEATVSGREAFINAIAGQESGGNYNAENGDTGAYGKYQILPSNWPSWAEEAGIGADAPRTPENQEIVARFKLGQYYDKYGARGAAIAWYGGEGALNYSEEALNRKQGDNGEYPSINEYADEVLGRMGNVADSVRIDDTIDDTEENYFDESNYTDDTIPASLNPIRGFDVSHLDKGTAQDRNSLLYGERVKKAKPAPASEEVASFNQSLDSSNAQKAPNSLFANSRRSWDTAERIYKARAKEQAERKARAQAIVNIANAQQQSFLNVLRNRAAQQWDNAEQEYKDRKQDKLQSLANVINARAAQKWDAKEADNVQKAKAEQEKQAQLQNIARLLDARAAQQWDNAERDANLKQNQAQALANLLNAKAAGQYDVAQQVYANRAKEQAEKQRQQQAIANIINARAAQKFDEAETADKFKFVPQRQSMYDGAMRRNLAALDKVKPEEQPSVEPTERNGRALDERNFREITLPKVREQHKWDKEYKEYHAERYGESALPQTQLLSTDRAARRNMPKPGIEARSFINDRAEKKSARERMQDAIAFVWKDDPKHPLKACRRQLNMFRDMRKEYLRPIYDVMAEGTGNGVSRIPIIEFDNQHRGRFYRQSNNSPWYAKYFKEHKKKPTQKAMYDIAEEVAFGENADVGYYAGVQGKELEAIVAENHAQLDPINDYIQTYESLELRLKENPNYGKEQAERINKAEEARRAEKRNAGETASAESIKTEAKQPAESNQDEVKETAEPQEKPEPRDLLFTVKSNGKEEDNVIVVGIMPVKEPKYQQTIKKMLDAGWKKAETNTIPNVALDEYYAPATEENYNFAKGLTNKAVGYNLMGGQPGGWDYMQGLLDHEAEERRKADRTLGEILEDEGITADITVDDNQSITIEFSKKPSDEVRQSVKEAGYKWRDGAWKSKVNERSMEIAKELGYKTAEKGEVEQGEKLNLPKGTTVDVSTVGDNSNIIQVKFNGAQGKGTGGIMGRAGYKWKSDKQVWQARKTEKALGVAEQLGYTEEAKPQERDNELERDELWDTFATKLGIDNILSVDKANEELKGVEGLHDGAIVYYDNNNSLYHIISKESDPEMLKLGYNYDVSTFDVHHMSISAGAVKTADEVIKRVKGLSKQKVEPKTKAKPSADTFSKNPEALFNTNALAGAPKQVADIIQKMPKAEQSKTTKKQTVGKQETKEPATRFDGERARKSLDALIGRKKKSEPQKNDVVPKSKFMNVFNEDELDAEIEKAKKEMSKLSANPMFNPALMKSLFKIGGIYLQKGVNKFAAWADNMVDVMGEKVRPFLPAVWDSLKKYPDNQKFNDDVMTAVMEYVGEGVDNGKSLSAIKREFADDYGDEYLGYVDAAFEGVKKYPTSDNVADVVESKQDKGGSQYDFNSTESLFSDDTGSRRAKNEIRTTSSSKESSGSNGQGSRTLEGQSGRNGNNGVPGSRTAVGGKTSVREGGQEASSTDSDASGSTGLSNSVVDSLQEQPNVNEGAVKNIIKSASDGRVDATDEVTQKVNEVIKENDLDKRRADRLRQTANVMPFLTAIQLHNTDFVAERFDTNGKQGVMITDGTGTGKTFSGLAIVKKMVDEGKKNIIIAAPNDTIINQWINAARDFYKLEVTRLKDTDDAGEGIVITTYANFGENEELVNRNWDMVICDESHNLMNSEGGKTTNILSRLRLLTYHPTELRNRAEQTILSEDKIEARKIVRKALALKTKEPDSLSAKERSIISASERIQANSEDKLTKEETAQIEAQAKEWEELNESEKPKVMFLSATPFAYVNDIDYANGYLFDYPKLEGQGYNQPNGLQQFLMEHFGYRMRSNKLTKPDGSVDNALMEMEFHEWLRNTGALTGHELEIDKDYNRGFILVDQGVGRQIDEGFEFLRENKEKYGNLEEVLNKQFDGRRRNYLLESIKARASVPIIREYLKAGKKVVVFHETNVERESFNPFRFTKKTMDVLDIGGETAQQIKHEWELFAKARPDLVNLNLDELSEPRRIYEEAFGDEAMFFNGRVPKKNRAQYVAAFNNDNSGKNLIIVQQDAGNAGISLHDTTGKYPRVEVNINIPRRPSFMIQIDGRIYRLGCMSNAIIRYLTTGTNIENHLFASTVAGRTSTAENLALGRKARGLRDSIIDSYQKTLDGTWVENLPGAEGEDVGGKESDRNMITSASDYDRAKGLYYGRGKKTAKTKAAEGVDYFATPEPIGYKMVQWANVKAGDKILEPSAGHGAISRFFSPTTENTIIEPSSRLAPQAQMNTENAKLINGMFEDLHISNKYDAITMNPPFGTGGKTAIEHLSKAFRHLREGGRVIALIPRGGMADKRFTKWYESDEAKNAHMVGEVLLPNVTFERAGTKVATRIVIIDKGGESQGVKRIDLSRINNINELFDNLESVEMSPRQTKQADAGTANFANSLRKGDAEGNSEVVTADSYKHTKTGEIIPSAKLNANLSDEEYRKVKAIAGKNGGYYSRYAKAFLFQDNEIGRDKFVEEVNGANNTQYSVSSEAVQRAKEEVEAEIRAAFPNGKVEYVNGVPTITMPNGSKFQYSIRENIVVNAKEQRKADAAHGTSGARVQGFWKKFTGNGVQRMLAVSQNSERGTAFHEAMHAAIDLVLTEKEKNALYNYYEKKAKEQNRDVDEVIADAYRDWVLARQRKSGTMFGKLWRKVKDFCTRIKALFDKGAEVERIMQDIESGRVYERGTNNHSVTKRISFSKEEADNNYTHYSVASSKHKIANAFTNTERKGVVDSVKDFFKEHRKSLYQDWFDKNNPLKGFDALTKATGGLSVYDQVQSLPATTAGMLKALTEGTAQHVKMANQHLKNVKMKYNVTLAMALEKIDKKQMDKAYPKYLAENGFDNWVNALGAYLGAERCLEMARLARAEGKTYKFPKGLTEQECQAFVNKAPQQFKAAADIFYKVNDNVISIMEDAEVFSHDLAKTLRTKYRKYCPLLRDFSDTAAADSFIGGLTEGGRGIGNVSVPLKRINIEGSERGVLNPLETILKSYAVMLNRAERNKVALMAVENSRTADLHELIQEVPGTTADPKNCVFTVLINGKKKAYKTTQDLYGPIVGYNLPAANLAFGVARTAARMLRTGATMSPSFILRNVLRDTVFAGIASKNGFIPIVDTIRGAIALAKDPAMRAEFEAAGVTEYNFYSSQKSRIKSLDAMAGETPASAWEIMKAVFSRLEATSDFFESSTRMGEYMKARQKGLSMEEAARAAREVTLDFSRSGRVGEQVNQVVPFFNACLQGGDKMVRLFREDFVGTSLKVLKYIVLPSLLIMAMNWDEDWYKDLDPDIKNNYWCLGRNIRIPKPQEAGVLFGSGIEALFQQAADKDKDAVSNFLKAFSSNMTPSVLPTLILPLIEWSANYSFFKGRSLVGNKYSRLPDELQYNDYTSELSKGIGSTLKVSPMKIDNLVRGYTGTMGALLWSMAGEPFAKANNLPAKHFSELSFVRDFNVTDANLSRPMNEFYGILDKANRQHAGYGVKGKPEAAVKGIRSAGSMISKIRKDIDKITHSNLTPERKRELIDKRKEKMNQIAKQATARYGKYFE